MSTPPELLTKLAADLGAHIDECAALPDGSGFAMMSQPLPKDHWLTEGGYNVPPMPFRMGQGPMREEWAAKIREAAKYAYRCASMNGKENDISPDALLQNMVVGMLGYWTEDGTSHLCGDPYDNPDPVPPLYDWPIRGVRVEGETVVIAVRGGNDAARWLCGEILAVHKR